jgi:hypothetical protein
MAIDISQMNQIVGIKKISSRIHTPIFVAFVFVFNFEAKVNKTVSIVIGSKNPIRINSKGTSQNVNRPQNNNTKIIPAIILFIT